MVEFVTRAYEPTDAAPLADLMNLLEVHAGGQPEYSEDEVRRYMRTMVGDVAANTRLVFAPDGALIAGATTAPPPDGGFRVDLSGGVHPSWRGRGIGRELFTHQLARAAELRAERRPSNEWAAHAGAFVADEDTQRLFRRFGLTPARYWFEMVASMVGSSASSAPAVALPDGLRSVGYTAEHEKDVHAAHVEAFADHWGYQKTDLDTWVENTVRSERFWPELSVLAFDGDEIAGYVLSYRDTDSTRVYIGHVGTRRQWRRRGVAGALLAEVLGLAVGQGLASASLGVDASSPTGAVGVYERVGFAVTNRAVTYALPLTD